MAYEVVIGVEVHAQLRTRSKLFCPCGTTFGLAANSQTCPVCLGLPGALPVINERAVEMAVRAGLALNGTIRAQNRFARKNYFYPDLPKGYQISQYEAPICENGWIEISVEGARKRVRIRRAHLEEDAGKNIHEAGGGTSLVDLNRAGTPLLEIVTEPDLRSSDEVVAYLKALRDLLMYLDVCDGNMEEGSFRCEPNLSLRPVGQTAFGTKVELKNINSFKFVKDAVDYEVKRQTKVLNEGGTIRQETRLWNLDRGETAVMRSKEEAHDYRYFPDPDLVPMNLSAEWIDGLRKELPELPSAKQQRFIEQFALPEYDAGILISSKALAGYFEACVALYPQPKTVSNWVMGELLRELKHAGIEADASLLSPQRLVELLTLVDQGTISLKVAREIFPDVYGSGKPPAQIVQERGLTQVSDEGALAALIEEVLKKNPAQVTQFKEGKQQVLGFLVGQVMKASGGKANPGKVNELLKKQLG
ncbi:MAG: Aspartyl/glutamyl-tRNA(Asn/Gln) amidotransferase subunit B [Nitrospirae bacterium]|nr:Aspartyl/glutamyl-tRNA(Asn/Gln) amidotransferase subunit B [Nitrospirota bacterium]MCE7966796.1 Asp-tRNA(Asn)/Glu-tRNA(Gln) amidotransferase subunit GatB [Nitrospira sp. NTP2]MCK6494008.1 Asp-tRNA(Asn)/Glu-tRNA(Gln) amidotransferase subunit GatB [Nitrospira sp.]MEB2339975.1 Asp-tRNA(Asn)/Glu-tRNA(Gln) amidotransferase subunit GatB [Nitrospirales bacterium]QOJ36750.1 MAG: Asp-tRNA(Asn)/Glu-tRNA(Gln) amidotransferase subunit GatB [Nitrospira sp.]